MNLRTFKTSDAEWETWRQRAQAQGMSLSAWLRRTANERAALEEVLERERKASEQEPVCMDD
jgi:hypothetical protein